MFDPKRTNVVNGAVVPQPANTSRFILAKTCLTKVSTPEEPEYSDDDAEYLEDAVEIMQSHKPPEPEPEVKPKITFVQRLKNLFSFK